MASRGPAGLPRTRQPVEAGAQGLRAGLNAGCRIQSKPEVVLRRDQAYIGVLIDDLITKSTTEPYRMFTSRAEYRLMLRQDNADLRLCEIGNVTGLLNKRLFSIFCDKRDQIDKEIQRLDNIHVDGVALSQVLRRPEVSYRELSDRNKSLSAEISEQVEIAVKYAGYIERQELEVERFQSMENKQIPDWLDYQSITGLRNEARQKLDTHQPATVGQASRISGISPSDVSLLLVHMKRGKPSD